MEQRVDQGAQGTVVKQPWWSSIRLRVLVLVLLAAVPAVGLMLFTAREQRLTTASQVRADAQRQAVLTAADHAEEVIAARQLLQLLSRLPSVRTEDAAGCNELLGGLLPQYPSYRNLTVLRVNGEVVCSAPRAPAGLNLSDRAYFRRAITNRDFAVGDYILGRISGQATIDFGFPVLDASGQVTQIVTLGMDLARLNQSLAHQTWPPGTTVTLIDQSGTIVGSYPVESRIGQLLDRSVSQIVLGETQGTARIIDPTGNPALIGFAVTDLGGSIAGIPVIIEVPEAVAFAQADRRLGRNLLLLGLAAMLTLLVAWVLGDRLVVGPIRALVRAARRLTAGELGVRVGPNYGDGEFGVLGRSLDHLADELQAASQDTARILARGTRPRSPEAAPDPGAF